MSRVALSLVCAASLIAWGCGADFEPTSIALEAEAPPKVGKTVKLRVIGKDAEGKTQELTEGVSFHSSKEAIATVDAGGNVTSLAGGDVAFTAKYENLEAKLDARTTCDYPTYSPKLQFERVFPPLAWPATRIDGKAFEFDLAKVHCDLDWKPVQTITFVLSATWCAPCTAYAQRMANEADALRDLGMDIVIIEVQNDDYQPADLETAARHVERIASSFPGIVAGDADTRPAASFLQDSKFIEAFPTVFVVRTSDMRMIAEQRDWGTYLPLERIAADPDADWRGEPFVNRCQPGEDEHASNHTPGSALAIGAGEHKGAICKEAHDFYKVDVEGPWTLTLDFSAAIDLDVWVWDLTTNQQAQKDGKSIGSSNGTNKETFDFQGPATIAIEPHKKASGPYTLTITER